MNVDRILDTFNRQPVAYLLIGGMNFLMRHEPVLTFDIDLWIEDTDENRRRCEQALSLLDAEWGRTETDWGPVSLQSPGWLDFQGVYSLTSVHGAIDIFRSVPGLPDWRASRAGSVTEKTHGGVDYHGISDADTALSTGPRSPVAKPQPRSVPATTIEDLAMTPSFSELKAREEAKRDENWDPSERWQVIQATIAWAAEQARFRRNTPAACLAEQSRKLTWLAEYERRIQASDLPRLANSG